MKYKMSTRRKLAIASWSTPKEGNIYGKLVVDMGPALRYIEHLRETSGEKVTVTHLVGKAAAMALANAPDLNGRIFMGAYRPHESVDLAFLVALESHDLAKIKVCGIDKKTTVEVAKELRERAAMVRGGKDDQFNKSKPLLKYLPTFLIRPVLWSVGYLTGAMGVSIEALGLEKFPFGACVVTSVGMLGVDEGYAPPTPFARVPVYIVVTKVQDVPVVENGQVVVRPQMNLMFTVDHRFMDGYQGAMLAKIIRGVFAEPWKLDGMQKPQPPLTSSEMLVTAHA